MPLDALASSVEICDKINNAQYIFSMPFKEDPAMSVQTWELFVARLWIMGLSAVQSMIRIAVIVAAAYIVMKLMRAGFYRVEALLIRTTARHETVPGAASKRITTLTGVLWTISCGFLWFIVVLTSLSQFGVNIGPILAGAGVVGLAVGFGAQHLVRDLVSGFFLILENQIRIGDFATINGKDGLVELITFRTISLRDQAGVVHVFPNGAITTLANATMDWSGYVIDVILPFRIDTDRVIEVMRRVGAEMKAEKEFSSMMMESIDVLGIDSFTDTTVTIKARLKTLPAQQHLVGREFRRRFKYALQAAGLLDNLPGPAAASANPALPAAPPS